MGQFLNPGYVPAVKFAKKAKRYFSKNGSLYSHGKYCMYAILSLLHLEWRDEKLQPRPAKYFHETFRKNVK